MIPLRVLLHLHEADHDEREPQWHGSADASRSSEFTARRRMAGTWDDGGPWDRAMDSLAQHGFHDSQMALDSGHRMWVYHQGAGGGGGMSEDPGPLKDAPGFHVSVWHPSSDLNHTVEGYLGTTPEHVGPRLRSMFSRRDVLSHLRDQMSGHTVGPVHVDMTQAR